MKVPRKVRLLSGLLLAVMVLGAAACGDDDPTPAGSGTTVDGDRKITVYSGRNEMLVGQLIEDFKRDTGIDVAVRYGESAELAAQIVEEGDNSPADVFFSQDAGALGALSGRGLLAPAPAVAQSIDARFRSTDDTWMGVSARARVIVVNREKVPDDQVPSSVFALTEPRWKGKVGIAPTNASFQSFVTGMRVQAGEERTRKWLVDLKANDPKIYGNNLLTVRGVNDGEVDLGLVNHYYLYEIVKELGADKVKAENHFTTGGDPGALVNVAGVGILKSSKAKPLADEFASYLLGEKAQHYFAEKTYEYPLIPGVPTAEGLPTLDQIESPAIDLSDLSSLEQTLALLKDTGLL